MTLGLSQVSLVFRRQVASDGTGLPTPAPSTTRVSFLKGTSARLVKEKLGTGHRDGAMDTSGDPVVSEPRL